MKSNNGNKIARAADLVCIVVAEPLAFTSLTIPKSGLSVPYMGTKPTFVHWLAGFATFSAFLATNTTNKRQIKCFNVAKTLFATYNLTYA